MKSAILEAAELIRRCDRMVAFTGAGISVESGIPPFRGPEGLWSKFDPIFLDLHYFYAHPKASWEKIKEIFYDFFGKAKPNTAHQKLAALQSQKFLGNIITQNIDHLHQDAGSPSETVIEYHGTSQTLICTAQGCRWPFRASMIQDLPPKCPTCGGLLKPDFIFFGEGIPIKAQEATAYEVQHADLWLVIGTTGEIYPASQWPTLAKVRGAKIIEINIQPSQYTQSITDIFIQAKATKAMQALWEALNV